MYMMFSKLSRETINRTQDPKMPQTASFWLQHFSLKRFCNFKFLWHHKWAKSALGPNFFKNFI